MMELCRVSLAVIVHLACPGVLLPPYRLQTSHPPQIISIPLDTAKVTLQLQPKSATPHYKWVSET